MKPHNKTWWRDKLDDLWSYLIRMKFQQCEVCGLPGRDTVAGEPIKYLEAHHLIGRGNWAFRWDINNGICLCMSCHRKGGKRAADYACAHGGNDASQRFMGGLLLNKPWQYEWYEEHREDKRVQWIGVGELEEIYNDLLDQAASLGLKAR